MTVTFFLLFIAYDYTAEHALKEEWGSKGSPSSGSSENTTKRVQQRPSDALRDAGLFVVNPGS